MRLIDADALIEAIEMVDWYHYNDVLKEMIHGANSSMHTPWYKADDIYNAIDDAPTIDAVELKDEIDRMPTIDLKAKIDQAYAEGYKMAKFDSEQSTIDLVRCRKCRFYQPFDYHRKYDCSRGLLGVTGDDFCSYGERRTE